MSDPVSNAQIEDVLSSIRRLVSEDGRTSKTSISKSEGVETGSDKLVLTPALRVTEGEESVPESAEEIAESSAPEETQDHNSLDLTLLSGDGEGAWASDVAAADDEREQHPTLSDSGRDEPYEPDTPGESDYAGTEVDALAWEDHTDDEEDDLSGIGTDSGEDYLARDAETFEVDGTAEDLAGVDGEESFIDEEMLRDLVADIVRQELQGALGERITRNVRKLVRREIHRALTAHDLN
ncbi:hypothetical protein SAMN04490248_1358 [Salinihabitans flavidus]|uniref:Uncharacterized protein n=1 Tax=Salinihabitans flavidus TaxID=569882 RepID=A0A1H8VUY8_9RHOB|nr:hypothetical protein [Salinihabitans flavidus]SEP19201.1 hypothetical protein SAMN04490248_1358 [Salinihabitans flavidus]